MSSDREYQRQNGINPTSTARDDFRTNMALFALPHGGAATIGTVVSVIGGPEAGIATWMSLSSLALAAGVAAGGRTEFIRCVAELTGFFGVTGGVTYELISSGASRPGWSMLVGSLSWGAGRLAVWGVGKVVNYRSSQKTRLRHCYNRR